MRASIICLVCCLFSAHADAQSTPLSLDALALLPADERADALFRLREPGAGLSTLQELELASRLRVDARRERDIPPLSPGCLTTDEFELDTMLGLARESKDRAAFDSAVREYRGKTAALDAKLATARRTNLWWKQFPALRLWEREWRKAKEPRTRELLYRTSSALPRRRRGRRASSGACRAPQNPRWRAPRTANTSSISCARTTNRICTGSSSRSQRSAGSTCAAMGGPPIAPPC
jgi:hypothetical protein